eukprot:743055-Pyramimonas_sp.AAC.1
MNATDGCIELRPLQRAPALYRKVMAHNSPVPVMRQSATCTPWPRIFFWTAHVRTASLARNVCSLNNIETPQDEYVKLSHGSYPNCLVSNFVRPTA